MIPERIETWERIFENASIFMWMIAGTVLIVGVFQLYAAYCKKKEYQEANKELAKKEFILKLNEGKK